MRKLILLHLIVFFSLCPKVSGAYSSVTVPIEDPVYRQLDKLASFGLIKTMMRGQRPYVRAEIGRLIAEAIKNYPELVANYRENRELSLKESERMLATKVYLDRHLARLKVIYRRELVQQRVVAGKVPSFDGEILEYIQGDFVYLEEPKGVIPPNNGIGSINAIIQPLVENRAGRHYQSGANWSIETQHWARLGKYTSFLFQPRFQMQVAQAPLQDETKFFVHRLNGHLTIGKFDLEIGRDLIQWGATPTGGLAFSTNPRPFDFVKLSSVSPFRYPFFFKHLGSNEMSFVLINLGPEQTFKNPWLAAYKISNRRNEYFEFGFSQLFLVGGEGAPSASFGRRVLDFFDSSQNELKENRSIAIELIGTIPKWRGMQIYSELLFSDLTTNMGTMFGKNTSYLAGVFLPRLNYKGSVGLRLEYRRLGARYNRSMVFQDGLTQNRRTIGDPLGPDSFGIIAQLNYDYSPSSLINLSFQYSHRNNNFYFFNGSSIQKAATLVDENRFMYRGEIRHLFNKHLVGNMGFGVEHVHNAGFFAGNNQLNWLAEIGFRVYLRPVAGL